jgi:hypothetical protein
MGRSSQTGAKLHDGSGAGQGLEPLTKDVAEQLSSDDFWAFVERLATGRRLVITSDHGYAAANGALRRVWCTFFFSFDLGSKRQVTHKDLWRRLQISNRLCGCEVPSKT